MASINSLMGSSSGGSIYGNRNVISGLASGMDTETMIENAVSGYKMKITGLQQQRTRLEWQQSAYRSIIDKMVKFNQKYMSFASGNSLLSNSFFDNAVKMISNGANASKVSAVGRTTSSVRVDSVEQLATSATYTMKPQENSNLQPSNEASGSFDVTKNETVGKLQGTLTLGYGAKSLNIKFDQSDTFKTADEMVEAINKKLEKETIAFDGGGQVKASERIKAVKDGDTIRFETVEPKDGNGVRIESASKSVEEALGIDTSKASEDKKEITSFTFDASKVAESKPLVGILSEKGMTITLNGETKTIQGPTKEELGGSLDKAVYLEKLQGKIDEAFGRGALTVSDLKAGDGTSEIQLKFEAAGGKSFEVTSPADKIMGMEGGLSSALNTSRKLGDLFKSNADWDSWRAKAEGDVKDNGDGFGVDAKGNRVKKEGSEWFQVDESGKNLYAFEVNGKTVATFGKDDRLSDVINAINKRADSPVKVSYSQFTGSFRFEARESGAGHDFEFSGMAEALFKKGKGEANYAAGQNAIFTVTVNNETKRITDHSSNTINIDGLELTMKGTFAADSEPVTFTSETDADKIIKVVKTMVEDYNAMADEIKKAYGTLPLINNSGNYYEPLTDEDRAEMSESAIKAYEEKAKTGLLFADRDLSALYTNMTQALGVLGKNGNDPLNLGLTISYSDGATKIELDEEKFRQALEDDPDKVKNVFTASKADGDPQDGFMQGLKIQMEKYAGTMGAVKGILIEKAGSPLAPVSVMQNAWQKRLDEFDKQIAAVREKMSDQVDFYNRKFTMLEQMVLQMNNQSSLLMGMNGGF